MVSYFEANLSQLSIHYAGNKLQDELYRLSDKPLAIADEPLSDLLMQYFIKPFEKVNEVYRLSHPSDNLGLNELFHFSSEIFTAPENFHENSIQIVKHLYDVSAHPKIKSGELHPAIGIFKSETKEAYLKVQTEEGGFNLNYEQEAINIKKLDKGCVIFNTEKEKVIKLPSLTKPIAVKRRIG